MPLHENNHRYILLQCDQMDRLFYYYLAIYSRENLCKICRVMKGDSANSVMGIIGIVASHLSRESLGL